MGFRRQLSRGFSRRAASDRITSEAWQATVAGHGRKSLKEKLLQVVEKEIGRVAREGSGNVAQMRFLTTMEAELKKISSW